MQTELHSYWFRPDNKKKWFANGAYDTEVLSLFQILLTSYIAIIPDDVNYNINNFIHRILVTDQLTRHFDRVNKTETRFELSQQAIDLSMYILNHDYAGFLNCSPAEQCFILLPLRHSRQVELVKMNINHLYRLMDRYSELDNSTFWNRIRNKVHDWLGFGSYWLGRNPNYYFDRQRHGKKIPDVYLNSYKASLECLANIQQPTHYPPNPIAIFPSLNGLLDPNCPFKLNQPIGFNWKTGKETQLPEAWLEEFEKTLPSKDKTLILSISGGGDSMACSWALKKLGYKFVCAMVNYGNRETCAAEVQMVHWWCSQLGVDLYVQHIDSIKRSRQACFREIYEKVTRTMRFNLYRNVAELNSSVLPHVILGHNRDDSFENIISNLVKRRSMYNLKAIKPFHEENGVWIYRPIRNFAKADITKFLEDSNGPYLYDSTPKWSFRGQTRDILVPSLHIFNKDLIPGLEDMADKMHDMSQRYFNIMEQQTIFKPDVRTLQVHRQESKQNISVISINLITDFMKDDAYWQFIFETLFHKYRFPMVGQRTIHELMNRVSNSGTAEIKYALVRNMECRVSSNELIVYLRPPKEQK